MIITRPTTSRQVLFCGHKNQVSPVKGVRMMTMEVEQGAGRQVERVGMTHVPGCPPRLQRRTVWDTRSAHSEKPAGFTGHMLLTEITIKPDFKCLVRIENELTNLTHLICGVVRSHNPNERRGLFLEDQHLPGSDVGE